MAVKKILAVGVMILVVATGVCCVNSCLAKKTGGLALIKSTQRSTGQSAHAGIVVVTHGWVEKGKGDWPEDMAAAISQKTDPNEWLCGCFDWSKGARTINPTDAARFARNVAGAKLADDILALGINFKHIHLLGHSSGCWLVSEAAKVLAAKTDADIHLTFLDAYVPSGWDENQLGNIDIKQGVKFWADHYYTRDYTGSFTECDLSCAHNVDITELDQHIKDHNFPWKWYYATITGSYPKGYFLDDGKFTSTADGIEYGFGRSKEACGKASRQRNIELAVGNKAVRLAAVGVRR